MELLSTSDTRVRCGECLSIFDALANLRPIAPDDNIAATPVQDKPAVQVDTQVKARRHLRDQSHSETSSLPHASAAALAGLANDTSSLDVTYSDFDLFSSDAGLPDVHFFDSTRHTPDFHFDDVTDLDEEMFSDTLFSQDVTVDARLIRPHAVESADRVCGSVVLGGNVGFITDDSKSEPLIFNYRDAQPDEVVKKIPPTVKAQTVTDSISVISPFDDPIESAGKGIVRDAALQVPESVSSPWLLRGLLFAIVVVIAGSLYGYREREAMFNNSFLRPFLASACNVLSCQLPAQIDLDALRAVDRSVVMHPTVPNALVIKFGIVNQASFSQPYPVLEIRLTDRAGRLVVINRFLPSEYLRGWEQGDVLDIGKRLDIGLAVEDPGNTAMSFELDFHEVK